MTVGDIHQHSHLLHVMSFTQNTARILKQQLLYINCYLCLISDGFLAA